MVVPNSDMSEADSPGDDGGMSGPPYHMDLQGSSDSDSELGDGDSVNLGGYQLLPQDPDQASDMEEPEEEQEASPGFMASPEQEPVEEQEASPGFMALPEAPSEWRPTEEMLRPAEPRPVEPLGQAQIQAIQAAMAGFELPSSHLPPWAKDVPEEEWKQCLYRKLRGLAEQQS
uniref:Male-enhanced antigen 1 n=1 Tax=Hyalomma excavatum TaxID=257692 RepID=A0A131XAV5_9ACAR